MCWQEILLFVLVVLSFLLLFTSMAIFLWEDRSSEWKQPIRNAVLITCTAGIVFGALAIGVKALWLNNLI